MNALITVIGRDSLEMYQNLYKIKHNIKCKLVKNFRKSFFPIQN